MVRVTLADVSQASPYKEVTSMPKPSVKVNAFPKRDRGSSSTRLPALAVCVKPLHFNFDKSVWLVEFIEMYRLQGPIL